MLILVAVCVCVGGVSSQERETKARINKGGTSLVVQWLRLCAPNAGGMGLTGLGTKIPHATWCGQKIKMNS